MLSDQLSRMIAWEAFEALNALVTGPFRLRRENARWCESCRISALAAKRADVAAPSLDVHHVVAWDIATALVALAEHPRHRPS
jgi:hypothetical protein